MEKKEPKRRSEVVYIRLYPEEKIRIDADAEALNKQTATYVREVLLGNSLKAPRTLAKEDRKLLAEAIRELNNAGAPLQQIAADLAVGDVPISITLADGVQKTVMASRMIHTALRELLTAGDDLLEANR